MNSRFRSAAVVSTAIFSTAIFSAAIVAVSLVIMTPALAQDAAPAPAPAPAPAAAPAPVVRVPTFENATCPIMGRPSSKALFTDTDFGRVYVCCPPCIKKIQGDPARAYQTAYPVLKKAGNTVDPVTGASIGEKPVLLSLQGYEIALASEASVAPARANAQIVLTKALDPRIVDVGNRTDPVTGQPVVDNAFVLIDQDLIHLASPQSVEAVRNDPEKFRKGAREIAAKEAAAREAAKPAAPSK